MLREQLRPQATKRGQRLPLVWERGRVFDEQAAEAFRQIVVEGHSLRVGATETLSPTLQSDCTSSARLMLLHQIQDHSD